MGLLFAQQAVTPPLILQAAPNYTNASGIEKTNPEVMCTCNIVGCAGITITSQSGLTVNVSTCAGAVHCWEWGDGTYTCNNTGVATASHTYASCCYYTINCYIQNGPPAGGGCIMGGSNSCSSCPPDYSGGCGSSFEIFGWPTVDVDLSEPAPVELLYFNAIAENNTLVRCEWSTASELNNDYFGIERSKDGIAFAQIAIMPSKASGGNSNVTLYYGYDDSDPYTGSSYYRLRQVDFNGAYEYSPVRSVYIGRFEIISIYPNPASDYIEYLVGSEAGGAVTVRVIDVLGREVLRKEETLEKGVTTKKVETQNFASGVYLLRITNGNLEKTQKQFRVK